MIHSKAITYRLIKSCTPKGIMKEHCWKIFAGLICTFQFTIRQTIIYTTSPRIQKWFNMWPGHLVAIDRPYTNGKNISNFCIKIHFYNIVYTHLKRLWSCIHMQYLRKKYACSEKGIRLFGDPVPTALWADDDRWDRPLGLK